MMMNTRDLPITYMNQLCSRYKVQHQCVGHKKISMFCWLNAVRLDLPANLMIHDPIQIIWLNWCMVGGEYSEPHPSPIRTVTGQNGHIWCPYCIEAITTHMYALGIKSVNP